MGYLGTDLDKYYSIKLGKRRSFFRKLKLWFFNYGLHCVVVFRFGQAASRLYGKSKLLGVIPLIMHKYFNQMVIFFHHVEIDNDAKIGPGFFLMHYANVNIGPVIIGENCTVHHNVTIGQRVADGDHGVATIGNNVWIGTGAVITGNIHIGNNVTISAGCIISKDIPDNCLAAGNPGRVIMQEYDNKAMINYTMKK